MGTVRVQVATSKTRCFHEDLIDAFVLSPLATMPAPHRNMTVFIAIDPTSGVRSELAIASFYLDSNQRIVVRFLL